MTDFNALKSQIEALISKAAKADDANDAMKFTQAATNAGQAMCMLRQVSSGDEAFRRRIASEIDKLNYALGVHLKANDGQPHAGLAAAQQALCWAMDPEMAGQPIKVILGKEYGSTLGESYAGLNQPSPPPAPPREMWNLDGRNPDAVTAATVLK